MNDIKFSANTLFINGKEINLDYPIEDAFIIGDKFIVFLDPDSYTEKFGQFQNLLAFSKEGNLLWKAELPTNESGDSYHDITSKNPLKAYSWKSFECEIDLESGRIKNRVFYK